MSTLFNFVSGVDPYMKSARWKIASGVAMECELHHFELAVNLLEADGYRSARIYGRLFVFSVYLPIGCWFYFFVSIVDLFLCIVTLLDHKQVRNLRIWVQSGAMAPGILERSLATLICKTSPSLQLLDWSRWPAQRITLRASENETAAVSLT